MDGTDSDTLLRREQTKLTAAGKAKTGGYEISDDEPDDHRAAPRSDAEARLTELRSLYDRGLITEEEYEAKRRDILSDLVGGEQNGFFNHDRCRCHRLWQARCKK